MTQDIEQENPTVIRQKVRKSNVRIVVTYFVVFAYCTSAVILTFVLLFVYPTKPELALGVFSGLSTLSAGIAGFWFGNRGTGYPENIPTPGGISETPEPTSNLIGAEQFTKPRPHQHETDPDDPKIEAYSKGAD